MKYFIMIMACCLFSLAYSQNCNSSLNGRIEDFHDGTPLSNATIYIESLNKYAISNTKGEFSINNLCDDTITIEVSHLGCDTKRLNVKIEGKTTIDIHLEHHTEALHEIKIEGTVNSKLTKTTQETVLNDKTISRYSSNSLGNALKEVAGVSSINTGNTIVKPVINGLHSSRVLVITNGVRLQDHDWGIEHAPNIDINTAGSINVIKGANALAYGGDAIGGVIVLKPLSISLKDSLYGNSLISAQSNGRGYNFNTNLSQTWQKGWYINGQASYKRFGDFEAANYSLNNTGLSSKGFSFNSGFKTFENGFNVNFSHLTNTIGILRSSHIGNIEDLVNAINSKQPLIAEDFSYKIQVPRQEITHQIFKADYYKRFKKFGRLEIQYDFQNNQRFEYDIRVGNDRNKPAIDLTLKTHTLHTRLKLDSSNKAVYEFGVHTGYQNNFPDPDTGVRRLIPDFNKYDIGAYAISNFDLNEKTTLDFGFRYDFNRIDAKKFYQKSRWEERDYNQNYSSIIIDDFGTQILTNPVFNYHNISASAGLSHQFNSKQNIIFNYGLSNRAPNPAELFSDGLHHSAARIELGDLHIKQETSNRISATHEFKTPRLSINTEVFFNIINDYIYCIPIKTEQTLRGAFPVWEYMQTNALLFGFDITAKYQFNSNWYLSHKSAFIKGRDLKANEALIDMPPFNTANALGYFNQKWMNFNIELQSEIVFKQNDFPNTNFETFIPTKGEMILVDISTPPSAYQLLHLQSDVTIKLSNKTNLNIGFNITNIFNASYRQYLNRLRYFTDDLGRNFMLQLKLNY